MRRDIPVWIAVVIIAVVVLVAVITGWRLMNPQRGPATTTEIQNLQQQMQKALQQRPAGPTQGPPSPREMMQRALQQQSR
ncbi:MAG: hypothetical protein SLRJCFUN_002175 [Candidatus Fervidibacter sp.]